MKFVGIGVVIFKKENQICLSENHVFRFSIKTTKIFEYKGVERNIWADFRIKRAKKNRTWESPLVETGILLYLQENGKCL